MKAPYSLATWNGTGVVDADNRSVCNGITNTNAKQLVELLNGEAKLRAALAEALPYLEKLHELNEEPRDGALARLIERIEAFGTKLPPPADALEAARSAAAQAAYEAYDFGAETVDDAEGFEHTTGMAAWTRTLYFTPHHENGRPIFGAASLRGNFSVVFKRDSAEVKDAYAMLNGHQVGAHSSRRDDA